MTVDEDSLWHIDMRDGKTHAGKDGLHDDSACF